MVLSVSFSLLQCPGCTRAACRTFQQERPLALSAGATFVPKAAPLWSGRRPRLETRPAWLPWARPGSLLKQAELAHLSGGGFTCSATPPAPCRHCTVESRTIPGKRVRHRGRSLHRGAGVLRQFWLKAWVLCC